MKCPLCIVIRLREIVSLFLLLLVSALGTVDAVGQVNSGASANLPSAGTTKGGGTHAATEQNTPPGCVPIETQTREASPSGTRHHKVILSWIASPKSSEKSKPVGYCLYRSIGKIEADQKLTCGTYEKVNASAFSGTSCYDNVVDDGATYCYVVKAVDGEGNHSSPSKEAHASIPPENQPGFVPADYPLPLSCQEESNTH